MAISFHLRVFRYKDNLFSRITGEVWYRDKLTRFWASLFRLENKMRFLLLYSTYHCWRQKGNHSGLHVPEYNAFFFIPSSLCFKTRLSALYQIWKWIFHSHANKTHFNNSFSTQRHSFESESFWTRKLPISSNWKTMICVLKYSFELLKIVVQ